MRATPKIQDYAAIGDGRSAALVSRDGSIDWLCWPRFDSPSIFGSLLDRQHWRFVAYRPHRRCAAPNAATSTKRTCSQTRFHTADGTVTLTDFMPAATEEQKRTMLWPEHELVRHVECERGEVEINVHFDPRPDYGRAKVRIRDLGSLGLRLEMGAGLLTLRSDVRFVAATERGHGGPFSTEGRRDHRLLAHARRRTPGRASAAGRSGSPEARPDRRVVAALGRPCDVQRALSGRGGAQCALP